MIEKKYPTALDALKDIANLQGLYKIRVRHEYPATFDDWLKAEQKRKEIE